MIQGGKYIGEKEREEKQGERKGGEERVRW